MVLQNVSCISFPIKQEIMNVSLIGEAINGICPPYLIQTWLQQYCGGTFFHSANCSFSNTISLRSVWCRRAMIPGEIFTSFAEFQGIVSVNDLWFPLGFQELSQASLGFLRSFCFCTEPPGSIEWLDPAPRLHVDDCFELRNCRLGPCDLLLSSHQIFLHEVRLPTVRLLHGALVILVLWQISQFRSLGKWVQTVFSQIRTSLKRRLWRRFMRRTGVWVSAFRNSVIHENFSEFLKPFRYVGIQRISPFLIVVFIFIWFWVGLVNGSPRSVLSTGSLDTVTRRIYPTEFFLCFSPTVLSLDTVEDVMVGEVDQLEEDVDVQFPALKVSWMLKDENWRLLACYRRLS